jgi:hypothetical protein
MFVALLGIARPDEQSALRVGRRYWEFSGAFVSSVQTMDKRSCHLRIEFKIEVAHGGFSVRSARRPDKTSIRADRRGLDAHRRARQLVIEESPMCFPKPVPQLRDLRNQSSSALQQAGPIAGYDQRAACVASRPAAIAGCHDIANDSGERLRFEPPAWLGCTAKITEHKNDLS